MNIEIYENRDPKPDWVHIYGDFKQFDLFGEAEDYVEETAKIMRQVAQHCLLYPLYIHFEAYEDRVGDIMKHRHSFDMTHQLAGRSVLTMTDNKSYQAEIPSFTVKIESDAAFQQACDLWFDFAFDNCMWLVTQTAELAYEEGFAAIHLQPKAVVLLPGHDAQNLSIISNDPAFQRLEDVRNVFAE